MIFDQLLGSILLAETDNGKASNIGEFFSDFWPGFLATWIWSITALVLFAIFFKVVDMILPGHLKNDVVDQKNVALAIVYAGAIIGFCLIIAAAMH